jgi:alpha-glucan phosphorylase-like protein
MVARGDLGVETPLEEVPIIQKRIIQRARQSGKPVITATQMLQSMVSSPRPTRAEATDVANAIFDGTDALMLSEETAMGTYPIEAVEMMDRIARATEPYLKETDFLNEPMPELLPMTPSSISRAACRMAEDLHAAAIVAGTSSGSTARLVARFRPPCPVVGLTPNTQTQRQLTLSWGVIPALVAPFSDTEQMFGLAEFWVLDQGLARQGDRVIVTAGVPVGIGGSEVLEILGIKHSVLHLNEGHPAFALLERIRDQVQAGMSYEEAAHQVKATTVFTTHTPVAAGHDVFPFPLMEKYFHSYWPALGLDHDSFLQLGIHPEEPHAGFNMTAFAIRMSGYCNGVSKRHAEVTRRMWHGLWLDLSEDDVPIDHVTNGIHVPTWIEPKMELLLNKYLGPNWLEDHDNPLTWELIDNIPDEELWKTHYLLKLKLIDAIRERSRQRWAENRVSPSIVMAGGTLLDPSILTLGFARRFATYKRADLIFYDLERLKWLLNDRWRPIQIIFAGKAHPADDPGKRILQRVFNVARDPEMGGRIAFVEDYGEQFAQYMVHGVDVWLNNPMPPMEASGTSGMKAALNGVPHLSIMDGWWMEGFNGKNGWAFGQEAVNGNRDQTDAEAIYRILEEEVIPLYYKVSDEGIPHKWVKIMKECIKSNAPRFSARRMVKEYIQKSYAEALKKI